jgi:hypothetical protein
VQATAATLVSELLVAMVCGRLEFASLHLSVSFAGGTPAHFTTCFFGKPGLILEVMKNELIETVILY